VLKPTRAFFAIAVTVFFLTATPVSTASFVRGSLYSFFETPLSFSRNLAGIVFDLFYFKGNAEENRRLKKTLAAVHLDRLRFREVVLENERLVRLLDIKRSPSASARRMIFSRVIGRSPSAWNKSLLIDKGRNQGVGPHRLVLADMAVVGKIVEAAPGVSKVLLLADPNFRLGVLIQRTRQQGVLFGAPGGECRIKYLSMDETPKVGDLVETAGLGGFIPKGFPVGRVERVWKEPGQIYQVAQVKTFMDLGRIEEVAVVE